MENDVLTRLVDQLLNDPRYAGHPLREALKGLQEQNRVLKIASTHDPLTGIGNRALLTRCLQEESQRVQRTGRSYCLAILDVDNFKRINDTWGHAAGDLVLKAIAQALMSSIREGDICGRWGGEEFLVIMPDVGLAEARHVVEHFNQTVAELAIPAEAAIIRITSSVGATQYTPNEHYAQALQRADGALLQAKQAGRARCIYQYP
ncbi:MAG TPA: diguanylate cyclase [Bordetella sp.]